MRYKSSSFFFYAYRLQPYNLKKPYLCRKSSSMVTCYVLFGSNKGDRFVLFDKAYTFINNRCGRVTGVSSFYESEPWGFKARNWFLNCLLMLETELPADELMTALLQIESELGRVRRPGKRGYTSRTVDLDLIYYGTETIDSKVVTVPHPRLHLRRFVLVPLCELCPDFVHPVFHLTNRELLAQCEDALEVRKIEATMS